MRQERISQALGWDTSRPGREFAMRALTFGPLGLGPGRAAMPPMRAPAPTLPELMSVRDRARPYNDYELGVLGHEARFEQMRNAFRDAAAQRREQQPAGPPRQARPNKPQSIPPSNTQQRGPTQGQSDLYALDPRGQEPISASRMLRDMDRSEAYWRARRSFDQMDPPPRNRMNALLPFAGAAAGGYAWGDGR
jgi:hypothetical protein